MESLARAASRRRYAIEGEEEADEDHHHAVLRLGAVVWISGSVGCANARQNMGIANRSIAAEFGEALEPYVPGKLCIHDNYCEGLNSEVIVTSVGRTVDAAPSSFETIEFYQRTCSAILSGLTGVQPGSASQYMTEIFNAAAQRGGTIMSRSVV